MRLLHQALLYQCLLLLSKHAIGYTVCYTYLFGVILGVGFVIAILIVTQLRL
jgi:hypothetical protein